MGGAKLRADRWRVGATVQEDGPGHACGPERMDLQFVVGCAVLVVASTRSFPGGQEREGRGGGAGVGAAGFASPCSFSVSLPTASAGGRGAAGVGVLQRRRIIFNVGRRSQVRTRLDCLFLVFMAL